MIKLNKDLFQIYLLLKVIYDFSTLHCQDNIQVLTYFRVWCQ